MHRYFLVIVMLENMSWSHNNPVHSPMSKPVESINGWFLGISLLFSEMIYFARRLFFLSLNLRIQHIYLVLVLLFWKKKKVIFAFPVRPQIIVWYLIPDRNGGQLHHISSHVSPHINKSTHIDVYVQFCWRVKVNAKHLTLWHHSSQTPDRAWEICCHWECPITWQHHLTEMDHEPQTRRYIF